MVICNNDFLVKSVVAAAENFALARYPRGVSAFQGRQQQFAELESACVDLAVADANGEVAHAAWMDSHRCTPSTSGFIALAWAFGCVAQARRNGECAAWYYRSARGEFLTVVRTVCAAQFSCTIDMLQSAEYLSN